MCDRPTPSHCILSLVRVRFVCAAFFVDIFRLFLCSLCSLFVGWLFVSWTPLLAVGNLPPTAPASSLVCGHIFVVFHCSKSWIDCVIFLSQFLSFSISVVECRSPQSIGRCCRDKDRNRRDITLPHLSFVAPFVCFQLLVEVALSFCLFCHLVLLALSPSIIVLNGDYRERIRPPTVQCLPRPPSCLRSFVRPLAHAHLHTSAFVSLRALLFCIALHASLVRIFICRLNRSIVCECNNVSCCGGAAGGAAGFSVRATTVIMFATVPWF